MKNSTETAKRESDGWHQRATFRFYEELNDFLSPDRRKIAFDYAFNGTPSVKDSIEAIGVPHPEVDLILVNDVSVGFDHLLNGGERVAVYPMFERVDISSLTRLRPNPLREPRFVLDVHLGKLARYLRLLGFDRLKPHPVNSRSSVIALRQPIGFPQGFPFADATAASGRKSP